MSVYDELKASNSRLKKHDGIYGIEIETESKEEYTIPNMRFWKGIGDGSLRDFGIEYVLKAPVGVKTELGEALKEFSERTSQLKFNEESNSTSVHVHMNILNETFKTLGNICTLYALFENILIEYSGPTRKSNLFCLPICDAEYTCKDIVDIFKRFELKQYNVVYNYDENTNKYAALNISSIGRLGSLEFRSFRGTSKIDSIREWVEILNCLYEYGKKDISPTDIILSWKKDSQKFIKEVFGNFYPKLALADVEQEKALVRKNFWYAASIAYSVKDWNNVDRSHEIKTDLTLEEFCLKYYKKKFAQLENEDQMSAFLHHQKGTTPFRKKKSNAQGNAAVNDPPPANIFLNEANTPLQQWALNAGAPPPPQPTTTFFDNDVEEEDNI